MNHPTYIGRVQSFMNLRVQYVVKGLVKGIVKVSTLEEVGPFNSP